MTSRKQNVLDLIQRPVFNYVLQITCTLYTEEQPINLHVHKFHFPSIKLFYRFWLISFLVQPCSCSNICFHIINSVFCLYFCINYVCRNFQFEFSIVPWRANVSISLDPAICHVINCGVCFVCICFDIWDTRQSPQYKDV